MKKKSVCLFLIISMVLSLFLTSCKTGVIDLSGQTDPSNKTTTQTSDNDETKSSLLPPATTDSESATTNVADSSATSASTSTTSSGNDNSPAQFSFIACPDNLIHPSIYYDCLKKAADKKGVTPNYKKLEGADYDFASLYTDVASYVKNADVSYINVETLIGGEQYGISGYPMFNTPQAAGETLVDLGFDIYNLAHNHMLDSANDKYLINCDKFFKDRGKVTLGYYENEAATKNIPIIERNGIKVAFLTYTFSTNGIKLSSSSPTYIPYANDSFMKSQVEQAQKEADLVFVSMHWGSEDTYNPNSEQRRVAQELCDWGVDVIIGMHPHVIQPMKWVTGATGKKTLLAYSLGNFISGMQDGFNMLGGMLSLNVYRDNNGQCGVKDVEFIPIVTHYLKKSAVRSDDTGHREYKIYLLKDYTEELASKHGVQVWDKTHRPTLVGGKFTKENLIATVKEYIPSEFLPSDF